MNKKRMSIEQQIKYIQDTIFVLSGKWKLPIILSIYNGNNRFRDLHRGVPNITTRVLSKELKHLETNKLITRTVIDTIPVTVNYTLSAYCHSLKPVVEEMTKWGKNHRKFISE